MSAGNGILKASNKIEALNAIEYAFEKSIIKHIVIEPYISGDQYACCTFIVDKKVKVICTNNEYSFVNPYRIEISTYPANNFELVKEQLINEAEKVAEILNLKNGILSIQYKIKDGTAYILEMMRRVLGNLYMLPAKQLTNFDWFYSEAMAHCGLDSYNFPKDLKQEGFYAYRAIMAASNGHIEELVIPSDIERFICHKSILHNEGYVVTNYKSTPLAFVVFDFPTKEIMDEIMLERYDDIYAKQTLKL